MTQPARAPKATLADLARLHQQQVAAAAQARAEREAADKAARAQQVSQAEFAHAVGRVTPLHRNTARVAPELPPVSPRAVQRERDEQAAIREALSDGFDASALLETDDLLSFRRPGLGPDVLRKLRRGDWTIQREIDLHGLRTDQARDALGQFVRTASRQGLRCIRVVHGKGLGSPGKTPVLKQRVHSWLIQKNQVLAFVQARPVDGGAGALVVLLKPRLAVRADPLPALPDTPAGLPWLIDAKKEAGDLRTRPKLRNLLDAFGRNGHKHP
jgi:DNA-nicking Smr family endonuclease